jgi:hypothetical protein
MTTKKAIITERSPQSEKFIEAARALGADESEEHFDAMLAKVARHSISEPTSPRRTPRTKRTPRVSDV